MAAQSVETSAEQALWLLDIDIDAASECNSHIQGSLQNTETSDDDIPYKPDFPAAVRVGGL
jgi:hypothetical protein